MAKVFKWPFACFFLILFTFSRQINADNKLVEKCNEILKLESDSTIRIKSPIDSKSKDSTQKYANNIDSCWYLIEVSRPIDGVLIEFNKFSLQEAECVNNASSKLECCDYLELGTGLEVSKDSVGKYCGSSVPEPILVENSTIWIKFSTNEQFAFSGFDLTISSFKLSFTEPKGEIASPNFAEKNMKYLNNLDIVYKIVVPEFSLIRVKFLKFDLENFENETCFDYIEMLEGFAPTINHKVEATNVNGKKQIDRKLLCSEDYLGSEMIFDTNELYFRFVTDQSGQRNGFRIAYEGIKYIFNEPKGVITKSLPTNLNLTYSIIAPADQKIELSIEEFDFNDCFIEKADLNASQRILSCADSEEYLMFVNYLDAKNETDQQQAFNKKLNRTLASSSQSWKFCSCNKPVRTYLSLSNRLNITYFTLNKKSQNNFVINYRFVKGEYKENNQLRIVQDQTRSYIGGFLLNVAVPVQNHLRIYGKSARCSFPASILLARYVNEKLVEKPIDIKWNNFNAKDQCSYLIDLNEPIANSSDTMDDFWRLKWFIKFASSNTVDDFELNWMFIENTISDDTESDTIALPLQNGFDYTEELTFNLKSLSSNRNYMFSLIPKLGNVEATTATTTTKESWPVATYVKFREGLKKTESVIMPENLFNQPIKINSTEIQLKIKRAQSWSIDITYEIEKITGNCNFDQSICNYTINPINDHDHLTSEKDTFEKEQSFLAHKSKYNLLDLDEHSTNDKLKDFYLAIAKDIKAADVDEVSIYSPLIAVQPAKSNKTEDPWQKNFFNKKIFSVSFDYKTKLYKNNDMDAIRLFTVHERSDLMIGRKLNLNDVKDIFTSDTKLSESDPSFYVSESCDASTFYKFLRDSSQESIRTTDKQMENKPGYYWRHASNIPVFSCFDFRLGFTAVFNGQKDKDSLIEVGLDNVNMDYVGEVEECDASACNSNGQCVKFNGKEICCCRPGFEGEKCNSKVSACDFAKNSMSPHNSATNQLCKNDGVCMDLPNLFDYACNCTAGFEGKNCEEEINECASNPCKNNAKCIDLIGSYDCICNEGTKGKNCEEKVQECSSKCNSDNTLDCLQDGTQIICKCKPGFEGEDCSKDINECDSNPCLEGSTCVNLENDFKCICSANKTGKYCETFLTYCDQHGHLCQNRSKCIYANEDGSNIQCSCELGYTGKFCEKELDFCESISCNGGECRSILKNLDFKCICPKGKTGRNCEIQLEDVCYKSKCGAHGICQPIGKTDYICACETGYEGEFCEIETCNKAKHFREVCSSNGTITVENVEGECKCICKSGYSGNQCEIRKSLCVVKNYNCLNGGTCTEVNNEEVKCQCRLGYTGQFCEVEEDKCKYSKCMHGDCQRSLEQNACICYGDWQGENCDQLIKKCDIATDCIQANTISVQSMLNDKDCFCKCKNGFTGDRCEINIDDCALNAGRCKNNSTCVDMVSTFQCKCPPGFKGSFCDKRMASCDLKPCNNGTCIDVLGTITCECNRGFTGKYCETQIDKCEQRPCKNGGICHNLIDDFYCECPREYGQTKDCSIRIKDPCISSPCMNGGTCNGLGARLLRDKSILVVNETSSLESVQEFSGYKCTCVTGFTGKNCEENSDPCKSNPCKNGVCMKKESTSKNRGPIYHDIPLQDNYYCKCFPKFTGKNCETEFNNCEKKFCSRRGECLETPSGPKCKCNHGYTGIDCEKTFQLCDGLTCLNGGSCRVANKVPVCQCTNSSYTGIRCEIDIRTLNITTEAIKASSVSLKKNPVCNFLGNDVSLIDYILAVLIIFGIVIIIITLIYFFVYCNVKKAKTYHKQIIYENRMLNEMNEMSEKYV